MKKNKRTLLQIIPFIIIGFCLLWTYCCDSYENVLEYTASNMYTSNAVRLTTNTEASDVKWNSIVDSQCIVYSDVSESDSLRGVYAGCDASFSIPMLSGQFFSQENFYNDDKVAIIGKGLVTRTVKKNGNDYLQINDDNFKVIGVIGLDSIPSSLDYTIYVTMGNALKLFDTDLYYTFDGTNEGIRKSVDKFESSYETKQIKRQTVDLDVIYSNNNYSHIMYQSFAVIIFLLLILFSYFEVFNRRSIINVYNINSATPFQTFCVILKKYMMINYAGMLFGVVLALPILFFVKRMPFDWLSLLNVSIISLFVMSITSLISVLSFFKKRKQGGIGIENNAKNTLKVLKTCLLITTVGILIFVDVIINSFSSQISAHNSYDNKSNNTYYTITSSMSNEEFNRAYADSSFLKRMKNTCKELNSNKKYSFYEFINQHVSVKQKDFPYEFYYYHDDTDKMLNAIQVSDGFFNTFQLALEAGSKFSAEDYFGDGKTEIPVILGNAYKNFYSVGDRIESVEYLYKNYDFLVVGILKENSYYINQGNTKLLDYMMVMPSRIYLNDPLPNTVDYMSQFALYTQKTDGVFVLDNEQSFADMSTWVHEVAKKNGIYNLDFLRVPKSSAYFLQCISKQYIDTSYIILSMFLVLLFILIYQMSCYLLQSKKQLYFILLICGASFSQIAFKICAEIISMILVANAIAFITTICLIAIEYSVMVLLISILPAFIISSTYIYRSLNNNLN